ncbi:uncharacterized peroxidase-related enzyme [Tistlia consotensis]|uniref:Uncharacterized peroxidase-related enzyme n=1 Tax=Tistlia consotensis USBA 355 TaxID=560819 RepID=A0A1Y6CCF8_9PROT|nr:carboxymuconolactone decarboxylase family protein [Tistlia consotensis]SMF48182.1 uncharacterized peroxidase-related enzyme [Tistlia consotensis USBA 355]SNR81704.1 uncharacterized peroxidase-related enzyme [Tistlia consotensis]
MARLSQVDPAAAEGKTKQLLEAVQKKMGATPNITRVMANQPAVLEGYLAFSGAVAGGGFAPKTREAISLAVAGVNGCDYCTAAHSFIAGSLKVPADEIGRHCRGEAADPKVQAILTLSQRILETRGRLADADLAAARAAGLDDAAVTETVANVALNLFTNLINNVAHTDIDFPPVRP